MSDDEQTIPTPPTKTEFNKAKKQADALVVEAEAKIKEACELADKFGFGITILEGMSYSSSWDGDKGYYYTPHHTDESMWMPSDEEVDGSGHLDFYWASSTEGVFSSAADRDN
jgi:hypothetical protein